MQLRDQVTNLELSKRLKEFGIDSPSLFYWKNYSTGWSIDYSERPWDAYKDEWCHAYSVAELIDVLHEYTENIIIPSKVNVISYLGGMLIELLEKSATRN